VPGLKFRPPVTPSRDLGLIAPPRLHLRSVQRGQGSLVSPRRRDRMQTRKLRPLLPTYPSGPDFKACPERSRREPKSLSFSIRRVDLINLTLSADSEAFATITLDVNFSLSVPLVPHSTKRSFGRDLVTSDAKWFKMRIHWDERHPAERRNHDREEDLDLNLRRCGSIAHRQCLCG